MDCKQIYRRIPWRTAEHDDPVDWEVPNTLPGKGLGGQRSLSMNLHPDNMMVMPGAVMSPSQCELLMESPSPPGDAKGSGQRKAPGPSLEPPNPKGITALPSPWSRPHLQQKQWPWWVIMCLCLESLLPRCTRVSGVQQGCRLSSLCVSL